jgi:hypothetical protein
MPKGIPGVNARVKAGASHVRISHSDKAANERERAARALVAILPYSSAHFILRDPEHVVAARPRADTAERLVQAIESFGVGSIANAYSAYGTLLNWVAVNRPEVTEIYGSVVSDYMRAKPPSQTALDSLAWLADRCGIDLPVRAAVCRAFKRPAPASEHVKESISFGILIGLCALAQDHPSPHVRGQAAGFYTLAKLALRFEQSRACVVNSFIERVCAGVMRTFIQVSVLRDKHPDPSKQRPRPRWAVIDDLHLDASTGSTDSVRLALTNMLTGAEAVQCLILETDSKTGDPSTATTWVMSPLEDASRVDASLRGLVRLMGAPPEVCSVLHGHSFKRCLLNVAESSPDLSLATDGQELGAFSMSTSQKQELEPTADLLLRHELRAKALPSLYANKSGVHSLLDRLGRVESVLVKARDKAAGRGTPLPFLDGWDIFHNQ